MREAGGFPKAPPARRLERKTDMSQNEWEEEEFTTNVSPRTIKRMMGLTLEHRGWLVGFMAFVAIVAMLDGTFNFLRKQIIDRAITPADTSALAPLQPTGSGEISCFRFARCRAPRCSPATAARWTSPRRSSSGVSGGRSTGSFSRPAICSESGREGCGLG